MKSMLRRKPTLFCALAIGNTLSNSYFCTFTLKPEFYEAFCKEPYAFIRRFIDRMRKDSCLRYRNPDTEGLILTHAVYKPTNKSVGLLTKGLIEFWFKSKGAKISV